MPSRSGPLPATVAQAFDRGLFPLPSRPALATSAVSGTWKVPVILVDFPDQPFVFASAPAWEQALFDTTGATPTGSVFDYYRWASAGRFKVVGRVIATIRADHPKSFYTFNAWGLSSTTGQNSAGLLDEALRKCSPQIDWSEFDRDLDGYVDMVWMLHAGLGGEHTVSRDNFWSMTSRLSSWPGTSAYLTEDHVPGSSLVERVDSFSMLPELSAFNIGGRSEIGVFCHEFGHALGLPDLYDTAPSGPLNVGPGNWSLMSTGAYGTDGLSPQFPSHLGAWALTYLGWSSLSRPTRDTTLTLPSIERTGDVIELWFQGEASTEHFLIENRQREGFDRNLLQEGLLVYQVNDLVMRTGLPSNRVINGLYPGLRLLEGDGRRDLMLNWNHGDDSDPFPGTSNLTLWNDTSEPSSRSMTGNRTQVALEDIVPSGDDMRFLARVRARGWQPSLQVASSFQQVSSAGRGARSARLADGSLVTVSCEIVSGRPQTVLRERRGDSSWELPVVVSQSTAAAIEPTVAALDGGDLCVAWSDARHGAYELYYRSRVRGVWTPERRLTDLPGSSMSPAIGTDRNGGVHVAWFYSDPSQGRSIQFLYFPYLSPFGTPIQVTAPVIVPDLPALAVSREGRSFIVWPDRTTAQTTLWFAQFDPGSGLSPRTRLAQPEAGTLPTVSAVADLQGTLHAAWPVTGVGVNEIHYIHWLGPASTDTAVVRRGEPIHDFALSTDPIGGLHLVLEASRSGISQVLYKEWRGDGAWDVGETEVSWIEDGVAAAPTLAPALDGGVTVLYTHFNGSGASLMERDRSSQIRRVTSVANPPLPHPEGWRVLPNPVHAGRPLALAGAGPAPATTILLYDLAGRRVGEAVPRTLIGSWRAEVPGDVTRDWPSGVYFARPPDGRFQARIVILR